MRLRSQILAMVPQLRHDGSFPEGADVLALPMAQLGDWETAQRLATQQWTRDSLFHWRAGQLALRRDYAAAQLAAQKIADEGTRTDSLLLIARIALDSGDLGAAKTPLLAAMRVLDRAPDSAQLAYAAWLWGQSGDIEAARRVLWQKAYPRALRENELAKQDEPTGWQPRHESLVLDFASQRGLISDIIEKTKPSNVPVGGWILLRASNRSDIQQLRRWLKDSTRTSAYSLLTLAISAARLGMTEEAHELREEARLVTEGPPLAPLMELMLAKMMGEEAEVRRLQNELETAGTQTNAAPREDIPLLVALWRITRWGDDGNLGAYFDVEPAQLENAAAVILENPPSSAQLRGLETMARIYERRSNRDRLEQIAAATARNVQKQAEQYEAKQRKGSGGSWSYAPLEIAAILRDAQPGLEKPILDAVVAQTPPIFRVGVAIQLYKHGFTEAARQIFDPIEALRREAAFQAELARATPQQIEKMHQIVINWDDLAATQARYDAPDAPARWFGSVRDEHTRVSVLRAWTDALHPRIELKSPYVRHVGSSRWYRVGGAAGSSIGS